MRRKEADGPNPTFYAKDDQDFAEYGGIEDPIVNTPSVAITETEKVLTQAPVQSGALLDETGMSNREPMVPIDETGMSNRESASENTYTWQQQGAEHTFSLETDEKGKQGSHVDSKGIITMVGGVVPDKNSISLEGKPVNPRVGHTYTTGSDLSKLDFSKATKTIRGSVLKREDYATNLEFSEAVYNKMAEFTRSNLEDDNAGFTGKWNDISREGKMVLADLDYNTGVGAAVQPPKNERKAGSRWGDTALLATELTKPVAEQSTDNLIKFTQNFRLGTTSPRGLLRRRLIGYNLIAKPADEAVYIKQHSGTVAEGIYKGKYRHDILRADGTIIKTWYKTSSPAAAVPILRVVDGEEFTKLPAVVEPTQASVDLTDWDKIIV